MPLNQFDIESVRLGAKDRAARMMAEAAEKFHRPEAMAAVGESWHLAKRGGRGDLIRGAMPDKFKEMEDLYGQSE